MLSAIRFAPVHRVKLIRGLHVHRCAAYLPVPPVKHAHRVAAVAWRRPVPRVYFHADRSAAKQGSFAIQLPVAGLANATVLPVTAFAVVVV